MRLALACLAGTLAVGGAIAPAAGAAPSEDEPVLGRQTSHLSALDAAERGVAPRRDTPADGAKEGSAADFVELSSSCATGLVRGTTRFRENFDAGLPYPEYTEGWAPVTGDAGQGTGYARSEIHAEEGTGAYHWLPTTLGAPPSGRTVATFKFRTNAAADHAWFVANEWGVSLYPQSEWTTVYLDITQHLADSEGDFFVEFAHENFDVPEGVEEYFDVDDFSVYSCVAPPASGIRGDWTGEGTVDLLGTTAEGTLHLYPGKGTGGVSGGTQVGSGWSGMSWMGSPGDVNGDRRTDLVAMDGAGSMFLYAGQGAGRLGASTQVGSRWGSMTALATPGDVDRDGRPDLLARRSDSTLHLYQFRGDGSLRYLKQVGRGWNGMKSIIGMGDLNGDGRGDAVGVNAGDGCLYGYVSTSSGGLTGVGRIGCGWGSMDILASPGDLNGDALGDLIARRSDGTLWSYLGRGGGRVGSGTQVGSGWGGMTRLT